MPDREYTTEKQIEAMHEEIRRAKEKMHGSLIPGDTIAKKKAPRRVFKAISAISFSLMVILLSTILISVLVARSHGEVPSLLGFQLYVVESGSMEPTLNVGSVILSKRPADPAKLKVGDIVTFKTTAGVTVTHKIININTGEDGAIRYQTKGDNPINIPDLELLTPDRVVAVLIMKIPLT